ncbi:MAG: hypothetical protein ABL908_11700 [Hyphomicrobium sp.]
MFKRYLAMACGLVVLLAATGAAAQPADLTLIYDWNKSQKETGYPNVAEGKLLQAELARLGCLAKDTDQKDDFGLWGKTSKKQFFLFLSNTKSDYSSGHTVGEVLEIFARFETNIKQDCDPKKVSGLATHAYPHSSGAIC